MEARKQLSDEGKATLEIRLLGGFGLSVGEAAITSVEAPRLQSLLAYLVLDRDLPHPRERLASVFWPDSTEAQARTNLRRSLHLLRRALPDFDRFLESETRSVRWRPDAPVQLDVAQFEQSLADAREAAEHDEQKREREALEAAVALYQGDLLPACYDEWVVPVRERLHETYLRAGEQLAELLEAERDYRAAIPWARRLVEHEPLNEESCRRLMRLYAAAGDRAGALRVYHVLATSLAREVGVEPSPATRELHERLLEPSGERSSAMVGTATAASPLVGRADQWKALRAAWDRASRGEAALVLITGEAGIGKSRLCEELRDRLGPEGAQVASSRCYSAGKGLAYAPVVELLRSPAIATALRQLGDPWLSELARLLPELPDQRPELAPPAPLTEDWQRTRLLDSLAQAVLATDRALLLTIDDLHWADGETLGWLHYTLRSRPQAPLLLAVTARSEELDADHQAQPLLAAARASGQLVELELGPLDQTQTVALARNLSGPELDQQRQELVYRETEGNPLFVVEWLRSGLADASGAEDQRSADTRPDLPARTQSVIEARLAQLSPAAQELAGLAAVVGREFRFKLLHRAGSRGEEELVEALDELWRRRIIRELGADAYDFSHDKLREQAYWRIGTAHRRMLHRRVAAALEANHAGDLDAVSSQLALHYERAGVPGRAIDFYALAAEVALRVFSNERAIRHYSKAIELLTAEPESKDRDERELVLHTALGAPLVSVEGYGAAAVHDVYVRAAELCERLELPLEPAVLRALAIAALARGKLSRAYELGEQLLERGERDNDSMVRVEGNYVLGVTSFWLGEFARSRRQLERALAEYRPGDASSHIALFAQDPKVVCLSRLAYALRFLGEEKLAESTAAEAINLAEELEHPFSLAYALNFAAWLSIDLGDQERARERAERMAKLADEQSLGFLQAMGSILRGWVLAGDGQSDQAIDQIRAGIDAYDQSGWSLYQPYSLVLLARVCLTAGRVADARLAVAKAVELTWQTGQRAFDGEIERLQTELANAPGTV